MKVKSESITDNYQVQQAEQETARVIHIGHLLNYLLRVKDGRKRRGIRYPLEVILVLFIMAKLCGENKVYGIADWVQLRSAHLIGAMGLKLKRQRLPHHSTYRRILTDEINA
ncbi:MAG TPA: transposase family protein, partial [Anaerolineales bacterium]|nr:transposase family protein [Anaerolineales bacterium]